MNAKIQYWSERLFNSYWFIPTTMAFGAVVASQILLYLDQTLDPGRLFEGKAFLTTGIEGARATLSTIASSMITVTGVVFSITIVSLSLASQQFGPRLLQHFMRDRGNQLVLGTVTSTFLYCLLVLRTIGSSVEAAFVPNGCVFVAVIMAVFNVGVLIYFIHHTAESIQVSNIIRRISDDLSSAVQNLCPERQSEAEEGASGRRRSSDLPVDFDRRIALVRSNAHGYIQTIDVDGLVELAAKKNLMVRLLRRPGHYLVEGGPLAEVYPGDALDGELAAAINERFVCSYKRSQEYDLEFLVNQLVEIASRALSPGVNDPFTAIACIDHLTSALCELAQRADPPPDRYDAEEKLRVVLYPTEFSNILDAAFNQIRQYGRESASVTIRLLESLETVAGFAWSTEQREAILRQAKMIERGGREGLAEGMDVEDVRERYLRVCSSVRRRKVPADEADEKIPFRMPR